MDFPDFETLLTMLIAVSVFKTYNGNCNKILNRTLGLSKLY